MASQFGDPTRPALQTVQLADNSGAGEFDVDFGLARFWSRSAFSPDSAGLRR